MAASHTNGHPELWLRPSAGLSLAVLSTLIEAQRITATPRLGARDAKHPKGYQPGQEVMLRVLDEHGAEYLHRRVRIESLTIRPLRQLTEDDLHHTLAYQNWEDVQRELSQFEKRLIDENEDATVVEFSYL